MSEPAKTDAAPPSRWAIAVLLLLVLINMIGFGVVMPLLPFYGALFKAEAWQVTLLFAAFAGGQFLGELCWGRLSDRIGRRPVILLTIFGSGLGYIALAFAPGIWTAVAARAVGGFLSGNISTIQSYVVDITPRERLAGRLGLIGSTFGVGFVVGPTLGGLLAHPERGLVGFQPPLLVAAALSALAALGALLFVRESRHAADRTGPGAGVIADLTAALSDGATRQLLGSTLATFIGFAAIWSTLGLWGNAEFGWGPRVIGLLLGGNGVAMAVVQGVFAGMMIRRLGEIRTILIGLFFTALPLIMIVLGRWEWAVAPLLMLVVAGNGATQPATTLLLSRAAGPDRQGAVLGANTAAGAFARVIGPIIAGFLFGTVGHYAPSMFAAAMMAPAAWLAWRGGQHLKRTG